MTGAIPPASTTGAGSRAPGAARSAREERDPFGLALWVALGLTPPSAAPRGGATARPAPSGGAPPLSSEEAFSGIGGGDEEILDAAFAERAAASADADFLPDARATRSVTEGLRASAAEASSGSDAGGGQGPDPSPAPAAPGASDAASAANRAEAPAAPRGAGPSRDGIRAPGAVYRAVAARAVSRSAGPSVAPGASMAARVLEASAARLLAENARPVRSVTVPFRDEEGAGGRILLTLRGKELSATILSSSGDTVKRLRSEIADMRRSLESRGFTDPRIAVRVPRAEESAAAPETHRDPGSGRDPDVPRDAPRRDRDPDSNPYGAHSRPSRR